MTTPPALPAKTTLSDAAINEIASDLRLYSDYQPGSCQAEYLDPVLFARAIEAALTQSVQTAESDAEATTPQSLDHARPVYQVLKSGSRDPAGPWQDASKDSYEKSHPKRRRMLYIGPASLRLTKSMLEELNIYLSDHWHGCPEDVWEAVLSKSAHVAEQLSGASDSGLERH